MPPRVPQSYAEHHVWKTPQRELTIYTQQGKLSLDLSNSRAIENLLHEVFTGIQVRPYLLSIRRGALTG